MSGTSFHRLVLLNMLKSMSLYLMFISNDEVGTNCLTIFISVFKYCKFIHKHCLPPTSYFCRILLIISTNILHSGSGNTYTMRPLLLEASQDILRLMHHTYRNQGFQLFVSFFEIYGGKLFDLLNDRR